MKRTIRLENMLTMTNNDPFSFCKAELAAEAYEIDATDSFIFARGTVNVVVVATLYLPNKFHMPASLIYTNDSISEEDYHDLPCDRISVYALLECAKRVHCSYLIIQEKYHHEDVFGHFIKKYQNDKTMLDAHYLLSFTGTGSGVAQFFSAQQDFIAYIVNNGFAYENESAPNASPFKKLSPAFNLPGAALSCGLINDKLPHLNLAVFEKSLEKAEQLLITQTKRFSTPLQQPTVLHEATAESPVMFEVNNPFAQQKGRTSFDATERFFDGLSMYFTLFAKPFSITLAAGTTEILENSFWRCSNLVNIIIPPSVKRIGNSAFAECNHLKEVYIPDSVTDMGDSVFSDCTELTTVHLPAGLKILPDSTFRRCASLVQVTIPDSVVTIEAHAFSECRAIEHVILPPNLTKIGESAFEECTALKEVTLPESVCQVGKESFMHCIALKSVYLSDSIKELKESCFAQCHRLLKVHLPAQLEVIGNNVFRGNNLLSDIALPSSVHYIGRNAFNITSIATIELPKGLLSIEAGTFYYSPCLTTVIMHEGIEAIGKDAFGACAELTEVIAPKSVQYISEGNKAIKKQEAHPQHEK